MSTVTNYAYTGAKQTITLKPGRYKLECWGAQGGYRSSSSYGGLGGYSVGEISLEKQTTLHVYVGGSGNTGKTNGGFNGGGKRSTYNGGGGATDIRVGTDSLYARVIVAGGGGSDGATNKNGMYGGGETGGTTTQNYGSGGGGGTQTAGGVGGSGNAGTFGQGGEGKAASNGYAGAGGGGWYGGGGSFPDSSGDDDRGGGGGSGFAWTGKNAPSGYLLGSAYYLTNASTKPGNTSFTAPGGSSETGHSGNGYARITCLELYKQVPDTPANFRQTAKDYFSLSVAWGSVECTGYKLYRDGTLISTQTGTTYTDTSVEPNNTYTYKLVAYNSEGDSDPTTLSAKTSEGFVVKVFEIASAVFAPNPVNINSTTKLSVEVMETVKILEPYYYYSGDLYAGEV